jgi:hypothetical protein
LLFDELEDVIGQVDPYSLSEADAGEAFFSPEVVELLSVYAEEFHDRLLAPYLLFQ